MSGSIRREHAYLLAFLVFASSAFLAVIVVFAPTPTTYAATAKFIPTFLVYYGGGPALTSADTSTLATFDLIDIDRYRYNQINGNTWAAIKALNPASQLYLYEIGPEISNYEDAFAAVSLNNISRYDTSRGHPMGNLNGNHPELFQQDATGHRIYSSGFSNPGANQYSYLMDFGSPAYQSYWLTAAKSDIIDQAWVADGIFADNCLTFSSAGGYNALSTKYGSNAAWSSAMNAFSSAIASGLHSYGQKLWCNKGDTRSAAGSAAWAALDASAAHPDVLLEEGAFAVMWGSAVQFFPETEWRQQIDTIAATKNSKAATMSHTQLSEGGSGIDNWGKPVTYWQALWYSMGSFLLAKNDVLNNDYFMFNGGSGYDKIWHYGEYDAIDLGKALGAYTVTTINGVNVYWREFEKGYVAVNPTVTDVASWPVPQASRQLTHDNFLSPLTSIASVTSVPLKGHTAAILMKTGVVNSLDATAPSVPTGLAGVASTTQIGLSWNPSTDNVAVAGYYVYLNDTPLATTTATSFTHRGLISGVTYSYRVSAYDAVPNHSAWTATPVSITTATSSVGTFKFMPGDNIQTTSKLKIHAAPLLSSVTIGTQPNAALGTILSGPVSGGGYTWWQVNYASGVDGWSAENYLAKQKFIIGSRLQTTQSASVKSSPGVRTSLGLQLMGALGTVVGGPVSLSSHLWWQIDFASGPDGWVTDDMLTALPSVVAVVPLTEPSPSSEVAAVASSGGSTYWNLFWMTIANFWIGVWSGLSGLFH